MKKIPTNVPDGWTSWNQVDDVTVALNKLAFQISSRRLMSDWPSLEHYRICLASPVAAKVQAIRSFVDDWYDVFVDATIAPTKLRALRDRKLEDSYSRFTSFQKQMKPDMYRRISTAFKDERFEKMSNAAESFARKVKRIQKSRYGLRTEKSTRDFLNLE